MRRSRGKTTVVVVVAAVSVGLVLFAVAAGLVHNWLTKPVTVSISDDSLLASYAAAYPSSNNPTIDKRLTYNQQWIIADLNFAVDEHAESDHDEANHQHVVTGTRCVFAVSGQKVEPLACSSEGFFASDFSDTTPDSLIERANQPL